MQDQTKSQRHIDREIRGSCESSQADRRTKRTKQSICDAFVDLVLEEGFEAVRISEIVKLADINRGTFYLHYCDKFDLIKQIEDATLDELRSIDINTTCDAQKSGEKWFFNLFMNVLEYMRINKRKMLMLFSISGDYSFLTWLYNLVEENIKAELYPFTVSNESQLPLKYLVAYLFNADIGVIRAWLDDDCRESKEKIAELLSTSINKGPAHVCCI